ncbi:aspartyl aminopeptidase [Dacryopinax primogenitus]|uniref:aspartyl aminopeptidase n=1 Tax=Dacryopinax primogenitus (strain DJM 731) TaxID=1858805 RepID=M5GFE1_DACPD|nr:aspartyl aminopeptidase [Dacryopinax primogenitus]EJU06187.1 aspartyl aminopeptidase [Dacryopinax primogenitus]
MVSTKVTASKAVAFLNGSPTPFHAVRNASARLEEAGFTRIRETDQWELKPGGRYYYTREQRSLIAFTLPQGWKAGTGVSIVATHTDSPNLRIRPVSNKTSSGYLQVAVETYGGGLWHTWFDRDLSVAGRVVVATPGTTQFQTKLVKVERPLIRIPNLAIHLDRTINDQFKFNKETEFIPFLGVLSEELNKMPEPKYEEKGPQIKPAPSERHHPALLAVLAEEMSCAPEEINDFELALYDTNPSTVGGLQNEFVFSPRLDNLMSTFCALEAICESVTLEKKTDNVNCIAMFDHEEIGSASGVGAQGSLLPSFLSRLSPTPEQHAHSVARSMLISADMTHAFHPSYASKYQDGHRTMINGGMVIKTNANQRYATEAIGAWVVRRLAARRGGAIQDYEGRNDMPCGSTVGPLLSQLGLRTVDVGAPMWSMHSVRETCGAHDVPAAVNLFLALFEGWRDEVGELMVD